MKKFINKKVAAILGGAAVLALMLTGCQSGPADRPGDAAWGWFASEVKLPDGRTVPCVAAQQGGVDCDWESAR